MLYELIYTSIETRPMTDEGLMSLLEVSRQKNKRLKITGLLFYLNKEFVQLLEGDQESVLALYETIRRDDRHQSVKSFWEQKINARGFKNWSMAFASTHEARLLSDETYSKFLKEGISGLHLTEHPTEGRHLIMNLREILTNEARNSSDG